MRYGRLVAMVVVFLGWSPSVTPAIADGVRYVVPSAGNAEAEYPLWRSWLDAAQCGRARLNNWDRRQWCEDGTEPGTKRTVGVLTLGAQVEVVNGTECRDLVHVRVLTGPHKGAAGCVVGHALSLRKPD